ncbi:MAG TPA: ABC transporter ATP-binding protein [Azospirillum sp.]
MPADLLSVRGLHSYYGRAHILAGIDLSVGRGEVVALVGRNGAGKSTTLRSIMGLVEARRGAIAFDGHDISTRRPYEIARLGLGYVPEDRRIFTDLTVRENLEVGRRTPRDGAAARTPAWTPERVYTLFPNLAEARDRAGGQLSGGEQQMLTIARTLMGNPAMILLDEPSEGIAPRIVEMMATTILELKKDGLTVMLSEQNLHFAAVVSDRAFVIEKGRIRYEGRMADLKSNEEVRRAYLTM